jgi:hypothetical protein
MKQYRITSENSQNLDSPDDCYLAPTDPIHELKRIQYLGGLGAQARLTEYRATLNQGSNISVTGMEKQQLEKKHNIKPGTPEWFKLWFSLPYMTGEKPVGGKND